MKKNFKVLLVAVFVAIASCSFTTKKFDNPEKDKLLIDLITYVLEKGHYSPKDMDDAFSRNIYKNFIDGVDPLKRYFLNSDIEEFKQYETAIDDQIKIKDVTFFKLVYTRLTERIAEIEKIYPRILELPFDYSIDEELNVDYDKITYPKNIKALENRWRKQLKFTTISNYYDLIEENGTNLNEKPTEGKNEDYEDPKNLNEIEIEARENTKSSMSEYFDFVNDLESKDYFGIFLNTIVEEFDPHTNYFAPSDRDRFELQMSGKLEGIGARLQKKNDYIKIVEVISGGPAWRGEHVEVGDMIMKVRQESEKEAVSIIGMRLDDAVKLIKGPKDTEVRLTIRKKIDGEIKVVPVIRDLIRLEETYAKSTIIKKDDNKYGLISLPKFYVDFDNYKTRNCASDVKKEIIKLKKEGIKGLVLDLRNNGGGSLQTVVDMTGLFIKEGPVVQVKSFGDRKQIVFDKDPSIFWEGPLVILVNQMSASASEILAAALQDYNRAVIVGSTQSFGKGTVQNVIDLNRFLSNSNFDLGALKITTDKFYRINGGSVQVEGVKSDITIPNRLSFIPIGENDEENPLEWDQIDSANYKKWDGYFNLHEAIKSGNDRINNSPFVSLIKENAKWIASKQNSKSFSLNYSNFKKTQADDKKYLSKFDDLKNYKNDLQFEFIANEEESIENSKEILERRKRWKKGLQSDFQLNEGLKVLDNLKSKLINKKYIIANKV